MSSGTVPLTVEQRDGLKAAQKAERALRRSSQRTAAATAARDRAVRAAIAAGVRPAELARRLKLSPQRILQINKETT